MRLRSGLASSTLGAFQPFRTQPRLLSRPIYSIPSTRSFPILGQIMGLNSMRFLCIKQCKTDRQLSVLQISKENLVAAFRSALLESVVARRTLNNLHRFRGSLPVKLDFHISHSPLSISHFFTVGEATKRRNRFLGFFRNLPLKFHHISLLTSNGLCAT